MSGVIGCEGAEAGLYSMRPPLARFAEQANHPSHHTQNFSCADLHFFFSSLSFINAPVRSAHPEILFDEATSNLHEASFLQICAPDLLAIYNLK